MSLKRYIEGKGWVSIAGPSTSNNSKAINVSVSDTSNLFDTDNVEGALAELGYKVRTELECSIVPKNPRTKQYLPLDNEVILEVLFMGVVIVRMFIMDGSEVLIIILIH